MVAILALIGEAFLQSRGQPFPCSTLGLGESGSGLAEFVGMGNLLASREGDQGLKA